METRRNPDGAALIREHLRARYPEANVRVRKGTSRRSVPDYFVMWILGPAEEEVQAEVEGLFIEGEKKPRVMYARVESYAALRELRPY